MFWGAVGTRVRAIFNGRGCESVRMWGGELETGSCSGVYDIHKEGSFVGMRSDRIQFFVVVVFMF